MKNVKIGARVVMGLLYVVFGLNFFLQFLPMPPSTEAMGQFTGALFGTGYFFQFVKSIEVIFGALLILNFFTPLALVVLAPITVNIVLAHLMLDPGGIGAALLIFILHVFLGVQYLGYYKEMLVRKATV